MASPEKPENLNEILASLPLEGCGEGRHHLTGWPEYQASEGRIFRMTGEFVEEAEVNEPHIMKMPQSSRALLIREGADEIAKLQATGLSETEAQESYLRGLVETAEDHLMPEYKMPESFEGKGLAIIARESGLMIRLHGQVHVWIEGGMRKLELPSGNVHYDTSRYVVFVPDPFFYWSLETAEGAPESCSVELIDYEEPEPDLVVPELETYESLWTPREDELPGERLRRAQSLIPHGVDLPPQLQPKSEEDTPF